MPCQTVAAPAAEAVSHDEPAYVRKRCDVSSGGTGSRMARVVDSDIDFDDDCDIPTCLRRQVG